MKIEILVTLCAQHGIDIRNIPKERIKYYLEIGRKRAEKELLENEVISNSSVNKKVMKIISKQPGRIQSKETAYLANNANRGKLKMFMDNRSNHIRCLEGQVKDMQDAFKELGHILSTAITTGVIVVQDAKRSFTIINDGLEARESSQAKIN